MRKETKDGEHELKGEFIKKFNEIENQKSIELRILLRDMILIKEDFNQKFY